MKALGLTSGIGSMLIGARDAGFEVIGNIEWRKYYHAIDKHGENTFRLNFPDAFFAHAPEDLSAELTFELPGTIDLAIGHPECGAYSNLGGSLKNYRERQNLKSDIPLFIHMAKWFKPNFIVMDDLPRSLAAFTPADYHAQLPEYDLFFEWVSNWGYGNIQKGRNRLFLVAARKEMEYAFIPGELNHQKQLRDLLGDLVDDSSFGRYPNHHAHNTHRITTRGKHLTARGEDGSWGDIADAMLFYKPGDSLMYHGPNDSIKNRIGVLMTHWDRHSHTLTGFNPTLHPIRRLPLSIRERARIQGFPDSFVFNQEKLDGDSQWDHFEDLALVRHTGKAMPIQFNRYVSKQIRHHLDTEGKPYHEASGERILNPNDLVSGAKEWFCKEVGYANQRSACENCWLRSNCALPQKHQSRSTSEKLI